MGFPKSGGRRTSAYYSGAAGSRGAVGAAPTELPLMAAALGTEGKERKRLGGRQGR